MVQSAQGDDREESWSSGGRLQRPATQPAPEALSEERLNLQGQLEGETVVGVVEIQTGDLADAFQPI